MTEGDIIKQGFVKRNRDEWIGWTDYYLGTISGKMGYYLSATLHKPRMDKTYKIYVHRYLGKDDRIEDRLEEGESKIVYEGTINSATELKQLLKCF